MRRHQDSFLKDNLRGEKIKLLFNSTAADGVKGLETRTVPYVFVHDVNIMIADYLDRLNR